MENWKIYYLSSSNDLFNYRYVGYTKKDIQIRLKEHIYYSKHLITHKDKWIQNNILLKNTIISTLIEENISLNNVDEKEIFHIKLLKQKGFKLVNGTDGGGGIKNPSKEIREKISRARIGTKASQETKDKISAAGFNKTHSEETKIKMSINNGRATLGKKYSIEKIAQMSKNAPKKAVLQYDINDNFIQEFISLKSASVQTDTSKDSISKCCKNTRKTANGFKWKFKEESIIKFQPVNTKKAVIQYDMNLNFIKEFDSISQAVKETNGHRNHISECCKGKSRSSGGFIWKFKQ